MAGVSEQLASQVQRAQEELRRLDSRASEVRETIEVYLEELDVLLKDRLSRP